LVALRDGAEISHDSLHTHCTSQLARFKAPKEFIFVDHIRRLGNGKADYRWAKSQAAERAMT
jgi:3-oxocholest-4-en-26-oate---CoA ligase